LKGRTLMRYHITFANNVGGSDYDAIAQTYEGAIISTVSNYDGEGGFLAVIDIPDDLSEAVETDLDADLNVIGFRVVRSVSAED
jgi:hypothetical protein